MLPFFLCLSTIALPALELSMAFLADKSSVTIVSIVRLTYVVKDLSHDSLDLLKSDAINCPSIFIWTSVEANVSIICGQYMTAFSVGSCPERKSANITAFAVTSSMPSLSRTHTIIHLHKTRAAT